MIFEINFNKFGTSTAKSFLTRIRKRVNNSFPDHLIDVSHDIEITLRKCTPIIVNDLDP